MAIRISKNAIAVLNRYHPLGGRFGKTIKLQQGK